MLALLPEVVFPVAAAACAEELSVDGRHLLIAILDQAPAGERAQCSNRFLQPQAVEVGVEEDQVEIGGHDDEGVDAQVFVLVTVVEVFGDDEAGFGGDEDGQRLRRPCAWRLEAGGAAEAPATAYL